MAKEAKNETMEKIVALCKRRGFIYPSFEIYGGLAGFYDYGPLGVALKKNITNLWWKQFVTDREDVLGVDTVEVTKKEVLEASGHVGGFADPMVECEKCKRRFREDSLDTARDKQGKCPECGGGLGEARQFNMMLKTHVGASALNPDGSGKEDDASTAYLRPETAQGIFSNFKNVVDSFHPKLPFGIAQIGKAFRNEIAPRDFLFRVRELEQMEVEYFVKEGDWKPAFEMWRKEVLRFIEAIGIDAKKVSELEVGDGDRAHYSKRTIDFEFEFPFGRKELYGLAYRTNYDLTNHQTFSGVNQSFMDEDVDEPFIPHVIEPSLGVGRSVLAVLLSAYTEDEMNGEVRTYLKFKPSVAPIKVAVFPLLKNKPQLVEKAREVFVTLKKEFGAVMFDDNGNIGKRYRRQDEIGTPFCVTIDFDTVEKDQSVTVRDRDTGKQERINIAELTGCIRGRSV
ncbi:MAG: glycine--tRNA ligase [bacterium]|nr:glycine--tRNA ligase [bacterium]